MTEDKFQNFISKVLIVAEDFAKKNNGSITFGEENQKQSLFILGKSPLKEGLLYYINTPNKKTTYHIKFIKGFKDKFTLRISNSSISLELSEDLKRFTAYPSEDFNRRIDNIDGNFDEKLTKYLYMMWDFSYALQILYASQD
ncbi:hypothetical protein [Clostridium sp. 001]|uniref:hypothetical protein n=1 Tax=Clostridium sp. 001 TaxID=1970093 RepID=UPI001C2BA02B|nr:hypothetical protein [Clostridium sp. 001]QXE20019.1 hypothetical protein B5S50_14965 [Clostridium sp. 001]